MENQNRTLYFAHYQLKKSTNNFKLEQENNNPITFFTAKRNNKKNDDAFSFGANFFFRQPVVQIKTDSEEQEKKIKENA